MPASRLTTEKAGLRPESYFRAAQDSNGTAYRWKITGLAFKGETTSRGIPATWVAGYPAARAVAVPLI